MDGGNEESAGAAFFHGGHIPTQHSTTKIAQSGTTQENLARRPAIWTRRQILNTAEEMKYKALSHMNQKKVLCALSVTEADRARQMFMRKHSVQIVREHFD